MITTMDVSTGNNLRRLFWVMPTQPKTKMGDFNQYMRTRQMRKEGRTSTLVSTEDTVTEEQAVGVDGGTYFLCISARAHRVDMHLILVRYAGQELSPARTEGHKEDGGKKNLSICAVK